MKHDIPFNSLSIFELGGSADRGSDDDQAVGLQHVRMTSISAPITSKRSSTSRLQTPSPSNLNELLIEGSSTPNVTVESEYPSNTQIHGKKN